MSMHPIPPFGEYNISDIEVKLKELFVTDSVNYEPLIPKGELKLTDVNGISLSTLSFVSLMKYLRLGDGSSYTNLFEAIVKEGVAKSKFYSSRLNSEMLAYKPSTDSYYFVPCAIGKSHVHVTYVMDRDVLLTPKSASAILAYYAFEMKGLESNEVAIAVLAQYLFKISEDYLNYFSNLKAQYDTLSKAPKEEVEVDPVKSFMNSVIDKETLDSHYRAEEFNKSRNYNELVSLVDLAYSDSSLKSKAPYNYQESLIYDAMQVVGAKTTRPLKKYLHTCRNSMFTKIKTALIDIVSTSSLSEALDFRKSS